MMESSIFVVEYRNLVMKILSQLHLLLKVPVPCYLILVIFFFFLTTLIFINR